MTSQASNRRDITALIPAAGRVPEGVLALSNIACPAMIPVGGRPVIHWTLAYLRELGIDQVKVAVARRGLFVEDFVECTRDSQTEVSFVVPPADLGVAGTLLALLEATETPSALVILGDTHFALPSTESLSSTEPFVLTHPVEDSYRWCVAAVREDGTVTELFDKVEGLADQHEALIGVYWLPDVPRARAAARAVVEGARTQGRRAELSEILRGLMTGGAKVRAVRAAAWLDCGNPDRQAASHRALLQNRAFNELSIDSVLGTITKRSRNVEKFIDEISYLQALPPDVAVLFPRVLAASTDPASPSVTLEYYGYPTLSEMFVFENVDPGIWEQVFRHLFAVTTRVFMTHTQPLAAGALTEMLVEKTRKRMAALTGSAELLRLAHGDGRVFVNGRPLRGFASLWPDLERAVTKLAARGQGSIIHGDLCFSNILYDLRSRIVKLLDPRGSFGAPGIGGDIRYDVAKLYHSVHGGYDFIVNDLFDVSCVEQEGALHVRMHLRRRPPHEEVRHRFERVFFSEDTGFSRHEILLITGLLFASMPALHYDAPARQMAMLARALELLNEAVSGAHE